MPTPTIERTQPGIAAGEESYEELSVTTFWKLLLEQRKQKKPKQPPKTIWQHLREKKTQ